jgi:hypothetical protein
LVIHTFSVVFGRPQPQGAIAHVLTRHGLLPLTTGKSGEPYRLNRPPNRAGSLGPGAG